MKGEIDERRDRKRDRHVKRERHRDEDTDLYPFFFLNLLSLQINKSLCKEINYDDMTRAMFS